VKSVLIVAAAAAATALPRPAAPVTALAAANGHVAYATAWTRSRCERVVGGGGSYAPRLCPAVSTGRGVAAVELAGARVLWLGYAGGNDRDWTVETATPTRRRPRQLAFAERDVEQPAPLLLGPTDGSLLVYAHDRLVVALRANGSRAFAWTAPASVSAVAAAGGRVAVAQPDGEVAIVAGGRVLRTIPVGGAASSVAISGDGVVVQLAEQLSRHEPGLGPEYTLRLRPGARLEDADTARAVYVVAGQAHVVTFATGTDVVAGAAQHAQLDGRRLVIANGPSVTVKQL